MLAFLLACGAEPPTPVPSPEPVDPPAESDPEPTPEPERVQGEPLVVCINEFMPANTVSAHDESGLASDWIELHNPSAEDVPLDGWSMTDDPAAPRKHVFTGGLVLEAGGFLVLWADSAPDAGPSHLDFGLSDDGEAVGLYAPDGTGTVVRYGDTIDDVAVARVTDCCFETEGCLAHRFAGTPGGPN